MLFVLAETQQKFEAFCSDFYLRDAKHVRDPDELRGCDNAIVMVPMRYYTPAALIREIKANPCVTLVEVADTPREAARRDFRDRKYLYCYDPMSGGRRGGKTSAFETQMQAYHARLIGLDYRYVVDMMAAVSTVPRPTLGASSSAPQTPNSPPPTQACNCRPECLCKGIENS